MKVSQQLLGLDTLVIDTGRPHPHTGKPFPRVGKIAETDPSNDTVGLVVFMAPELDSHLSNEPPFSSHRQVPIITAGEKPDQDARVWCVSPFLPLEQQHAVIRSILEPTAPAPVQTEPKTDAPASKGKPRVGPSRNGTLRAPKPV